MFRPTDPQTSLLESQFLLPEAKRKRLEKSWAEPFRTRILPLIDEEVFRDAFCADNGRPNKSIRLLVGLHLLKETDDLTDAQILDQLEFNLQWHYALAVEPGTAHVCQKTLHNFRVLLMENQRAQQVFEQLTRAIADADGLGLGRQRMDSTHILSNIAVLTRLGLFVEAVTLFLKELRKALPEAFESLDAGYGRRYLDREGYFSDAKREQARRRLPVVAHDVAALVRAFRADERVSELPAFGLLVRLFEEQCEVVEDEDEDGSDGDQGEGGSDGGRSEDEGGPPRVKVREPRSIASDSLQSPHDPDATYGHKGKGYEVQVSESCDESNPYQLITGTSVNGAHESDQNAVEPMLDQLEASGMLPAELLADTGYGSGANIVHSAERNVDLQAPVRDPGAPPPTEHFAAPVSDDAHRDAGSEPDATALDGLDCAGLEGGTGLEVFTYSSTFDEVLSCSSGEAPERQHVAGGQLIATFSAEHCTGCPVASTCPTRLLVCGGRQLRRTPASIATEVRQDEQQRSAFKDNYRIRSGVESTNQELKGRHGMGDLRVRGRQRIELAVVLKSLALNVKRAVQWHVAQATLEISCPSPA